MCPGSLTHLGDIWLEHVTAWDQAQLPKDPALQITPGLSGELPRTGLLLTQSRALGYALCSE